MRVLLTVHQFLPKYSTGTEILTFETAKELKKRGHDVCIFTADPVIDIIDDKDRVGSYIYEELQIKTFKHSYVPMGHQNNICELEYNNQLFSKYFRDFLYQWKPDVVHFFHLNKLSATPIDICYELGIPTIYTATDFWLICPMIQLLSGNSLCTGPSKSGVNCLKHLVTSSFRFRPKLRKLFKIIPNWVIAFGIVLVNKGFFSSHRLASYVKALYQRPNFMKERMNVLDKVLVPTQLMNKLLTNNGLAKTRVQVLPFGINVNNIYSTKNHGLSKGLRIGFIGTLSEHKGAHILIKAVRFLKDYPVELKIYGDTKIFPDYVEKLIQISSTDDRISFCGTFPNSQIGDIFSRLDVLVVPSIWYENTPLVIYNAQAAGCPVIATDLGGMSEVIQHGVNGFLFKKGDIIGLANAIRRLCEDKELLKMLSENSKYPKTISEYVFELEKCYKEVMDKKGTSK